LITLATIQQAQKHDKKAQKMLYEQYANVLYRLAFRYLRERTEAEDVVAEAFCAAFDKMPKATFVNVPFFEAWLKRITVNEALQSLKKRSSFHLLSDTEWEVAAIREDTIEALTAAQLLELVTQLPVGYRTVFNLYEIEGYSHAEIAKMLNISEGTSKSQLSKAKGLLQKRVIELEQEYAKSKIVR
jgi:RNA polymerase sigma factor (sigma-70 family)